MLKDFAWFQSVIRVFLNTCIFSRLGGCSALFKGVFVKSLCGCSLWQVQQCYRLTHQPRQITCSLSDNTNFKDVAFKFSSLTVAWYTWHHLPYFSCLIVVSQLAGYFDLEMHSGSQHIWEWGSLVLEWINFISYMGVFYFIFILLYTGFSTSCSLLSGNTNWGNWQPYFL